MDEGSGGSDCPITTTPLLPFLHVDSERSLWRLALRLASFSSASSSCVNATRWSDSSPTRDNTIEMRSRVSREENVLHRLEGGTHPKLLCHPAGAVATATTPNDGSHRASATPSLDDGRSIIATDLSSRTDGRNSYDLIHRLALLGQDREGVLHLLGIVTSSNEDSCVLS